MTIFAVALDYKVCWNFDKEGITLHLRRLLKSLLENYPDLVVEIYAYDNNSFRIKNFFAEIYTQYPDRVRYCLGKHKMKKEYVFKEIKYLLKYKLFRKRKHLIRYAQIHREFTNNQEKDLIYMAQNSKADAVINVHPLLTLAHNFKCKKLLQTHDLFTIPLEELWAEVEPAVKHINKLVLKNLGEYVNEGGIFVTSTEYTAQTQIREYVKGVTAEQVKVIPFPPFVYIGQNRRSARLFY